MQRMEQPKAIALLGRIGDGKTYLLNKLAGSRFPSNMGAASCTLTLQNGYTKKNGILVIDTPGIGASDDIAAHIAAQKLALEGTQLSGVFIVVKFGRSDEMAEQCARIMTFLGSDDVRIIITWRDTAEGQDGFSPDASVHRLASLLQLPTTHVTMVGRNTSADFVETFITKTLHEPRQYTISDEQVATVAELGIVARSINKKITDVYMKIAAASAACADLVECGGKRRETDSAIVSVQAATTTMVEQSKLKIFQDAEDRCATDEEKHVVYGKAGLALSWRLKMFVLATNNLLSWNVTDPTDKRNVYKKCNHCGVVYNKTEGCDGLTVCGLIPEANKEFVPRTALEADFGREDGRWVMLFTWHGQRIRAQAVAEHLRRLFESEEDDVDNGDSSDDSNEEYRAGCGRLISWSTMIPISQKEIDRLAVVELQNPDGEIEIQIGNSFKERMRRHAERNRAILRNMFQNISRR